jgi:hypothetical protein
MNTYEIAHITDLADLEPDEVEAFCAELPTLVTAMRGLKNLMILQGTPIDMKEATPFVTWNADGKNECVTTIKVKD